MYVTRHNIPRTIFENAPASCDAVCMCSYMYSITILLYFSRAELSVDPSPLSLALLIGAFDRQARIV